MAIGVDVGVAIGVGVVGTATPTTIGLIGVRASAFGSASKGVPLARASLLEPIGLHAKWCHPKLTVEKQDARHATVKGLARLGGLHALPCACDRPHATGIRAIVGAVSIRVDRKPSRELSALGQKPT